MRFLCIGDIHGHSASLAAVLASAERRGYERLLVTGDLCFPGPDPLGTWRRLVALGATMVRGTSDIALCSVDPANLRPSDEAAAQKLSRFREVQRELGPAVLERMKKLPDAVRIALEDGRELLLLHGSPVDALEPFTHDMTDEELSALVGDDPADVIVCGGSHVHFDRTVGGVRIIGVGSVGEAPCGDPVARQLRQDLEAGGDRAGGDHAGPTHADAVFIESLPLRGAAREPETLRVERVCVPLRRAELEGAA